MNCVYHTVILCYLNTLNRNVGVRMLHLRSTVDVRSLLSEVDSRCQDEVYIVLPSADYEIYIDHSA